MSDLLYVLYTDICAKMLREDSPVVTESDTFCIYKHKKKAASYETASVIFSLKLSYQRRFAITPVSAITATRTNPFLLPVSLVSAAAPS